MTSSAARAADCQPSVAEPPRLLVTRRDPQDRSYQPIGFLTYDGHQYRFLYLRELPESRHLRVLPGLPEVTRSYRSTRLFPIFAERVISPRRPDRAVSIEALGLSAEAGPFEILQRSGGRRVGDSIEVVPLQWLGRTVRSASTSWCTACVTSRQATRSGSPGCGLRSDCASCRTATMKRMTGHCW